MTYAITLVKCAAGKREDALTILLNLKKRYDFDRDHIRIKECYISFGWPDFVLFIEGKNVELLKKVIVDIRGEVLRKKGGSIETSTIICTTDGDIKIATESIGTIQKK